MKSQLIVLFIILLTSSCAGKKEGKKVTIGLTLGNVASGVPLTGGVFITGTNGGDSFSFGTEDPSNINIVLPNGNWTIRALGWKSGTYPMEGTNVCGTGSVSLDGSTANSAVNLSLSTANCSNAVYADSNSFTPAADGTFKRIKFKSCLNLAGISSASDDTCDNSTLNKIMGESVAIKVILRGKSTFGAPISNLKSKCMAIDGTDLGGSVIDTNSNIILPINVGGSEFFPVEIQGFRSTDCGESADTDSDSISYLLPHGFGGIAASETTSEVYVAGTTNTIYWADNYIGHPESAFRTSAIAPIIQCSSVNCYGAGNILLRDNYPLQNVKEGVWNIVGHPEYKRIHDVDKTSNSYATVTNTGDTISLSSANAGEKFKLIFADGGACGTGHSITRSGEDITLSVCNDGNTSGLVTSINAVTSTVGIIASGTGASTGWHTTGSNVQMRFPQDFREREYGVLQEIKQMLYGPIGAILHKNGLTTLALVCADTGSYSETIINKSGELQTVTVSLSAGTIVPPNYMTTSNGTAFQKRIVLNDGDGSSMAYEINCTGAEMQNGWFAANWIEDNGNIAKTEVYYRTSVANLEAVEVIDYDNSIEYGIRKKHSYFQKTTTSDWRYFESVISSSGSWYSRIGAIADETGDHICVNNYTDSGTTTEINFTGAANGSESLDSAGYTLSSEGTTACTLTLVEPTSAVSVLDTTDTEYYVAPMLTGDMSTSVLDTSLPTNFNSIP